MNFRRRKRSQKTCIPKSCICPSTNDISKHWMMKILQSSKNALKSLCRFINTSKNFPRASKKMIILIFIDTWLNSVITLRVTLKNFQLRKFCFCFSVYNFTSIFRSDISTEQDKWHSYMWIFLSRFVISSEDAAQLHAKCESSRALTYIKKLFFKNFKTFV